MKITKYINGTWSSILGGTTTIYHNSKKRRLHWSNAWIEKAVTQVLYRKHEIKRMERMKAFDAPK